MTRQAFDVLSTRKATDSTPMKNYPDVTMIRCPVRGIVFYADGLGELAFKSAKEAQAATNDFRQRREATEQQRLLSCPNRVECSDSSVSVFTDNELSQSYPVNSAREARLLIGTLKEWNTHNFVWL